MSEAGHLDRGLTLISELERIIIVGASLAGLSAAEALRDAGWDDHLIVVDGSDDLPSDRPPLSKQVLAGTMEPDAARQPVASRLDELDIDLRYGNPVEGASVDGGSVGDIRIKFRNDHELETDGLIIASGASPRTLPHSKRVAGVFTIRDLADSLALRAALAQGPTRVVVIGAGFIGAEVAATVRGLGIDVTMIEATAQPMERVLPGAIGSFVADLHRANGVDVRLGVGVAGLERVADGAVDGDSDADGNGERVTGVRLQDGTVIDADVVVVGIGVAPNVEWLEGSGVTIDNGVRCDAALQAASMVVAAGDVANWPNSVFGETMRVEHWDHAIESGAAAARTLLALGEGREPEPYSTVPWFWSDQYDRKIQMAGRPAATDEVVVFDGSLDDERFAVAFRRGERCTGVLGVNRPRAVVMARMKMRDSLDWSHVIGS